MRRFRLLVGLLLLSAADFGRDLVVTSADAPGDCPVTECLPRATARIPDLTRTAELTDVGRAPEPPRYLRPLSWGITPALPPPKPLLSSN